MMFLIIYKEYIMIFFFIKSLLSVAIDENINNKIHI